MLRPHLLVLRRLLRIARLVRGDLRRSAPAAALLRESFFDLLTPRTRRLQILLRVAFDLRLAMLAALDLVAQPCNRAASSER